jgi:hypothetical protein
MRVLRLCWLGISAREYERMVELVRGVLDLKVVFEEPDTIELSTEDDDRIQVFAPGHEYFDFAPAPVVMFEVDDLAGARTELLAAGVDLVGDVGRDGQWEWQHFRAPDGHVYSLGARRGPRQPT